MKCLIVDDDILSRKIIQAMIEKTDFLQMGKSCGSAIEAAEILRSEAYDLVFLDVEMPDMTGLELLKNLSTLPMVILVTSKEDYAVEAFEYQVVDYLLKPPVYSRFLKAVSKARSMFEEKSSRPEGSDFIFVKSESKFVRINFQDILYVEAMGDYITINTPGQKIIVHTTMAAMERKLPEDKFIRVHRSYIINIKSIDSIEDMVILIGKKLIPVGASYKETLLRKLKLSD